MNRLPHLRETLPANLAQVGNLPLEFVVVDYGSSEDVSGWLRGIKSPMVRAFRVDGPTRWFHSHAKNIGHRLAEGQVVCNLDCDNFIVPGLTEFLLQALLGGDRVIAAPPVTKFNGKLAMRKEHFVEVGGYDERLVHGYGYEDTDLLNRALALGFKQVEVPPEFDRQISHLEKSDNHPEHDPVVSVAKNVKLILEKTSEVANLGKAWGAAAKLTCLTNS